MGRRLLPLMTALLLTGCAAGGTERFEAWQERLCAAGEISFTAEITASSGENVQNYTAAVRKTGDETAVTVTAPESISGVTFRSARTGRSVSFEGVTLSLPPTREGELAPSEAGELLLRALTEGHVLDTGKAGDTLTARLDGPDGITLRLWRTAEDVPVYAEIGRGEAAELILRLSDWETR